jgi:transcriptional regulator with XRE-family HTH domain
MQLEQAFGEILRAERKAKGLSQEALALEAGVERNYISLIELGRNSPSLRVVFRLCEVLEMPPSALLEKVEAQRRGSAKKGTAKK